MSTTSHENTHPLPKKPSDSSTLVENRATRRRRQAVEKKISQMQRGSEGTTSRTSNDEQPTSSKSKGKQRADPKGETSAQNSTFQLGDDFIPLAMSDTSSAEEERDGRDSKRRSQAKVPEREWDRGKPRDRFSERDGGSSSRKRGYDTVFHGEDGPRRSYPASKLSPWISDLKLDDCRNVAEMLHREVEAFVQYMSPSPVEDEIRGLIVQLVSKAITDIFPDATVFPFGSYETKLYLPDGDIDLVIRSQSMAYSNPETVLRRLADAVRRARITERVNIISKAKVPIIKFVTTYGGINVDVSVNQVNGVIAGQVVNGFLREMPGCGLALRSLVMILKAFLHQRGMNEVFSGGLGSYSIVCLAISFLQMHPKIRGGEIDAERNLGVLVMEFFELYGYYFNYEEVGISIRNGGSYYRKPMRENLLSIQDPVDPSNDISRGSFKFDRVRQTLAGAHGIMTAAIYLRAGILNSRRKKQYHSLRLNDTLEEMSILSFVGITQKTINHRRVIQKIYDEQILHKLLGISPKSIVTHAGSSSGNQSVGPKSESTEAVENLHRTSDADDEEMGNEGSPGKSPDGRRPAGTRDAEEEEKSRYDISGRNPIPRKRRKTGKWAHDVRTTFTTDEDEIEDGEESMVLESSDDIEEGEYELTHTSEDDNVRSRMDRRRSYWLSKGMGNGIDIAADDTS